ncbi:MAG: ATP phosphoribosyltransferase regulatory subunit [Bacillaceae bacterium]|nr:ATP phosphoribosyltransferase regulatory subunit [Bacillaceae bacterium]
MMNRAYHVPEGAANLQANELELKEKKIYVINELFKRYGYQPVQTPTFEYYDLFSDIEGTIDVDKMIKLIDHEGKILVLRPDATIPIARIAAQNNGNQSYYKFSYTTKVFRMNESFQSPQSREFTQAGVEFFGRKGLEADLEVITLAVQSLEKTGFEQITLDMGQAKFFKEFMNHIDIPGQASIEIQKLIENKNFFELEQKLEQLNMESRFKDIILTFPTLYGQPEKVFAKAENLLVNKQMELELDKLKHLYKMLSELGYQKYVSIDLGLINHLNYYTGIIFQGYVQGYGKPVVVGGRYDHLSRQFGRDLPATGFGIYIDALLDAQRSFQKAPDHGTDFLILHHEEHLKDGMGIANQLREQGFVVETDLIRQESYEENLKEMKVKNIHYIVVLQEDQLVIVQQGQEKKVYQDLDSLKRDVLRK